MHILLGFNKNKSLLKYYYICVFCSTRALQRHIDNKNPIVASYMANENIFCTSHFGQTIVKPDIFFFWGGRGRKSVIIWGCDCVKTVYGLDKANTHHFASLENDTFPKQFHKLTEEKINQQL